MRSICKTLRLFIAAATALIVAGATARAYPLVSHWAGEGNAQDGAHGNHGVVFNGVTYAPGVSGQAFRFDGVDDGIAVPDADNLKITGSLTIDVWVKVLGLPAPEQVWGMILFRGDNRNGFDPYFLGVDAAGRIAFNIQGSDNVPYTLYAPIDTGRFVHVVATLDDASGRMSLFLDGELAAHALTTVRPLRDLNPNSAPGTAVGNHSGYPNAAFNFAFNGLVDELKLYNTARRTSAAPLAGIDLAVGPDDNTRLLWNRSDGATGLWNVGANGSIGNYATFEPFAGWVARALAVGPDNRTRLLWNRDDGAAGLWLLSALHAPQSYHTYGPYPGWSATDVAVAADNRARILWNRFGGGAGLWTVNAEGGIDSAMSFGPYAGWTAVALSAGGGGDNKTRLLWQHADGRAWLWILSPGHAMETSFVYGPHPGWKPLDVSATRDHKTRLLWQAADGTAGLWTVNAAGTLESFASHGPFGQWTAKALAVDNDNKTRMLWYETGGQAGVWALSPFHAPQSYYWYGPY